MATNNSTHKNQVSAVMAWHAIKFNADQINDENGACHK